MTRIRGLALTIVAGVILGSGLAAPAAATGISAHDGLLSCSIVREAQLRGLDPYTLVASDVRACQTFRLTYMRAGK